MNPTKPSYDWNGQLPVGFEEEVVMPWTFRRYEDEEALAIKLIGLDTEGRRCWIRHDHTAVDERFDIDELPVDVPVGYERRIAWRLRSGRWLLQVDRIERLESCTPRVDNRPVVVVREEELGL
jgi:hypothetical protein